MMVCFGRDHQYLVDAAHVHSLYLSQRHAAYENGKKLVSKGEKMMARSLLFVHRTKADFAIFFHGARPTRNSGCPRAEPRRRAALAKRAAPKIGVRPLNSIRRSR